MFDFNNPRCSLCSSLKWLCAGGIFASPPASGLQRLDFLFSSPVKEQSSDRTAALLFGTIAPTSLSDALRLDTNSTFGHLRASSNSYIKKAISTDILIVIKCNSLRSHRVRHVQVLFAAEKYCGTAQRRANYCWAKRTTKNFSEHRTSSCEIMRLFICLRYRCCFKGKTAKQVTTT